MLHAADGSIPSYKKRRDAKKCSATTRAVRQTKATREPKKEFAHSNAARTRGKKMSSLMDEHENR